MPAASTFGGSVAEEKKHFKFKKRCDPRVNAGAHSRPINMAGRLMSNLPLLMVALLVVVTAEGADGHEVTTMEGVTDQPVIGTIEMKLMQYSSFKGDDGNVI